MTGENRIIELAIPNEHYIADATAVWCYDERFKVLLEKLYHLHNYKHIDTFRTAGGAKELATLVPSMDGRYILGQIQKSIEYHRSPLVILMVHDTCSAYGGKIPKEAKEKLEFFSQELLKAEKNVQRFLTGLGHTKIKIIKYVADFSGLLLIG